MLRGVSPPRSPSVGAVKKLGRGMLTAFAAGDRAQEPEIGGGKRVGLAQLPKRDVLRRPFADAADSAQPFHRVVEPAIRIKHTRIGDGRGCDRRQRGARLLGMPSEARSAAAMTSGRGKTCVRGSPGDDNGWP